MRFPNRIIMRFPNRIIMRFPNRIIILFIFAFGTCGALPDTTALYEIDVSKYLLGTVIDAKVVHHDINYARESLYLAFREIERIEHKFSTKFDESVINSINSNSGIRPVEIDKETFALLARSVSFSADYEALFDITVGPLTELWGFNSDDDIIIPTENEISALLPLVGYKHIVLDSSKGTVFLAGKGMKIDLGGVAKGYAVDRAADILKRRGVRNFMVNAGGDIVCAGTNSEGRPWGIGVKHPRESGELLVRFRASDIAISTSGDYERFIDVGNNRYHHILLPQTGWPGDLCRSVTVLSDNSELGTVIAKYIFLKGYEEFSKTELSKTIKYFIVEKGGQVKFSPALVTENELFFVE